MSVGVEAGCVVPVRVIYIDSEGVHDNVGLGDQRSVSHLRRQGLGIEGLHSFRNQVTINNFILVRRFGIGEC